MKSISRRQALKRGGITLAVTGVTATFGLPMMAKADDSVLLARIADFWKLYEKSNMAHDKFTARRAEVEAMPDYPPDPTRHLDWDAFIERRDEQFAFRERHEGGLYDAWTEAGREKGAAANAVFAIPAKTVKGALEKMKIARCAVGYTDDGSTGDGDLSCYQDHDAPWIDNALADLERLADGAA